MTEIPLEFHGRAVLTLRQIDRMNSASKGTAFRAFKAAGARLCQGEDFFRVDAAEQPEWMADLKSAGAHYTNSVHLVLITRRGYGALGLHAPWPEDRDD